MNELFFRRHQHCKQKKQHPVFLLWHFSSLTSTSLHSFLASSPSKASSLTFLPPETLSCPPSPLIPPSRPPFSPSFLLSGSLLHFLHQNNNHLARLPSTCCWEAVGCHSLIPFLSFLPSQLVLNSRKRTFLFVEGGVKCLLSQSVL